jgi:hypothetical protein
VRAEAAALWRPICNSADKFSGPIENRPPDLHPVEEVIMSAAKTASRSSTRISEEAASAQPQPRPSGGAGDGRDGEGRFTAGNLGGPGNPFARNCAKLRALLVQRVTPEDMGIIADALILKSRNGDLAATKLLFQYVLGKPTDAVNPDTIDIEEYKQIYQPQKEIMDDFKEAMTTVAPQVLTPMVRLMNEVNVQEMSNVFAVPHDQAKARLAAPAGVPTTGAPASAAMAPGDEEDPVVADINRLVYGGDDVDDENDPEENDAAPSTIGDNGQRAGNGRPSQPQGKPAGSSALGMSHAERMLRLAVALDRAWRQQAGPAPSTNGGSSAVAHPGRPDGSPQGTGASAGEAGNDAPSLQTERRRSTNGGLPDAA